MKLIIMGPPGAGKGTQATLIKDAYHIPHISTGDMFREAIEKQTALGIEAKKNIDKGMLVPDEITIGLVRERLSQDDCKDGFLLDGFPRTIAQAKALDEILKDLHTKLDAVINIDVNFDVLINRIVGRRVCPKCGASYHLVNFPPQKEGICDKCGTTLIQRKDDTKETVVTRLDVYTNQTEPLLNYYKDENLLINIDGMGDIDVIFSNIKSSLGDK